MDFKTVTKVALKEFQDMQVRYALIGGFALGALGVPRATVDLDFLVHNDDRSKIKEIMERLGYACVFQTDNVSQYVSPLEIFGEVDFLHAFRKTSLGMLARATEQEIFGKLKIRVLQAEDIIGLKVQAAANNEARFNREYADIEALMAYHGTQLDWELIREYFSVFEQQALFNKLKGKHFEAK